MHRPVRSLLLLVLAMGVLIFLLVFFIPRFQLVFQGFNAELPLITQISVGNWPALHCSTPRRSSRMKGRSTGRKATTRIMDSVITIKL